MIVEYAGFQYEVKLNEVGQAIEAVPVPGQHAAAHKMKHCAAACEQYNQEKDDYYADEDNYGSDHPAN